MSKSINYLIFARPDSKWSSYYKDSMQLDYDYSNHNWLHTSYRMYYSDDDEDDYDDYFYHTFLDKHYQFDDSKPNFRPRHPKFREPIS